MADQIDPREFIERARAEILDPATGNANPTFGRCPCGEPLPPSGNCERDHEDAPPTVEALTEPETSSPSDSEPAPGAGSD